MTPSEPGQEQSKNDTRPTTGFAAQFLERASTADLPASSAGKLRIRVLQWFLVSWWGLMAFATLGLLGLDFTLISAGHRMASFVPSPYPLQNPVLPGMMPMQSALNGVGDYFSGYVAGGGWYNLLSDLWVAAALAFLAVVWRRRVIGDTAPVRLGLVFVSLSVIFGRPWSLLFSFFAAFIPQSWWLLWPLKFVLLPPLILFLSGSFTLLTFYFLTTVLIFSLVYLPVKIFEALNQIANAAFIARAVQNPTLGLLFQFWSWFSGRPLPKSEPQPDDSKGARFATPAEAKALSQTEGMHFGYVGEAPLVLNTDKHILIMASTRSGKGVSLIIPHLLRYTGSAFVLDPKGENARASQRQRRALNDKVHFLDPFGLSGQPGSRFNPLSRFTPDNMEAESKALAAALVIGERDHWTASAQQLLAALMLYVVTDPDIPADKKDLITLRRLLLGALEPALAAMRKSNAADGLLADLAQSFLRTPEKELGSIISTAQRETEILDNPYIGRCLAASGAGDEVNFKDWHSGTMTVYLCLSAPKFPVFNRWLRLVLTAALDEMTDTLNPPAKPVCFLLDELATLGHLQTVENAVGLAAGYGIQLVTVFQDVAQMRDLYKGRWASFIGNAGVRALFSLDDYDTASYWSKFMGGHLVASMNKQQDTYGLTTGQSQGETQRPLLSPEEIMLYFAKGNMLVLPQGTRPIIAERVAYFQDASLHELWDDPRPVRTQ